MLKVDDAEARVTKDAPGLGVYTVLVRTPVVEGYDRRRDPIAICRLDTTSANQPDDAAHQASTAGQARTCSSPNRPDGEFQPHRSRMWSEVVSKP
jgi:hypothetical protein